MASRTSIVRGYKAVDEAARVRSELFARDEQLQVRNDQHLALETMLDERTLWAQYSPMSCTSQT